MDHGLAHQPQPIVLGVSGGPDSLSLLHTLYRLSRELGLQLHVAHFNHCLRADASDSDADFVKAQADALGIPFSTAWEYVKSRAGGHSASLEEKAREARYDFLSCVAHKENASGVAVAHTADDQAETILMHILRGSGLRGLRGMLLVSETQSASGQPIKLFRPLLQVTRSETETYCQALGLDPRIDHTNLLPETLRNRVRLQLLPLLREYNPRISDSLLRLADSAALDLSLVHSHASEAWPEVVEEHTDGLTISRRKLSEIHPALRRNILSQALESLSGSPRDIEAVHVNALEMLLSGDTGAELDLPRGIRAFLDYEHLLLTCSPTFPPSIPLPDVPQPIAIPGETSIPGWEITATIEESIPANQDLGPYTALFDMAKLPGPITVRRRREGDRFTPFGMSGSKKLQDFLTDAKVPRKSRDSIPVVLSGDQIIWLVGHRPSDYSKITEATHRGLKLQFKRINSDACPKDPRSEKEAPFSIKEWLLAPEPRTENLTPPRTKRRHRKPPVFD